MKLFKKIYYSASAQLPTKLVQKISPSSTLLPYHHLVSDEDVLHIKHLYSYKSVKQFTDDLDCLLKNTKPISVDDLVSSVKNGNELPKKSFLLTFDDGFSEVYNIIAPVLLKKGVPAIFFINPAFIDNKELFYRCKISLLVEHILNSDQQLTNHDLLSVAGEKKSIFTKEQLIEFVKSVTNLNKEKLDDIAELLQFSFSDYLKKVQPFLTTSQLQALNSQGFSIGAHSWDHPYYNLLNDEEKIRQTVSSLNFVSEKFNQKHTLFSFPHSDSSLSQSFFDQLKKQCDINLLFGIQNQKEEMKNKMLHRFNAERPSLSMSKQLNGILLLMLAQRILGKDKVLRK